jgi:hypothetical protein
MSENDKQPSGRQIDQEAIDTILGLAKDYPRANASGEKLKKAIGKLAPHMSSATELMSVLSWLSQLEYEYADRDIIDWKRVRSAIEHENELYNHRLTWLFTSQGFLLTAFGFLYEKMFVHSASASKLSFLLVVICIAGMLVSFFIGGALQWASKQRDVLRGWWELKFACKCMREKHPSVTLEGSMTILDQLSRTEWIPYLFVLMWIVILLIITLPSSPVFQSVVSGAHAVYGVIFAFLVFMMVGFVAGMCTAQIQSSCKKKNETAKLNVASK